MKFKKFTALILCVLVVFGVIFSACSKNTGTANDKNPTEALSGKENENETETPEDSRLSVSDDLPERDFSGAKFRIFAKSQYDYEISTDEITGDILNDTLYSRNKTVEERFNVLIEPLWSAAWTEDSREVQKSVLAGSNDFELAATFVFRSGTLVTNKVYHNWLDMDYINFDKPWWINSINENFRIKDVIYTAVGDFCVSTLKLSYAVFFNKNLAQELGMPDFYNAVNENKWTIDYFIETARNLYSDVNGNGKSDSGDRFGFTAEAITNLDMYLPAFGIPIIAQNSEKIPELVMNTPKTVTAVEKINELYWSGSGSYIGNDCLDVFFNGRSLFFTTWIDRSFNELRDMTDDYGILPYPKFDASQEKYMSGAMDNYSVLGIPITVTDLEMASIVTEAINAESYRQLFPVYFDTALKIKYARDEESIAMLDIIMNGRNYDMSVLFSDDLGEVTFMFRSLVAAKSADFTSKYEKVENNVQKRLERIIESCTAVQ